MNCSDVSDRLSAVYDGELSGAERDAVAEHLSVCERCAAEFAGFESLSRAIRESPMRAVPLGIWTSIAAQLAQTGPDEPAVVVPKQPSQTKPWIAVRGLALAASILLLLGSGVWILQQSGISHGDHGHEHSAEFAVTMDNYLKMLATDPDGAEQFLLNRYHSETVDPEHAMKLVGYRPAVAQGLPEGYSLTSTSVLEMPCCTCVKAVCKRQDGSTLVLFEHDDEKAEWFGKRPSNMATCGDTQCCLVELDSSFAATWKRGSRSVTAVGVRDEAEVSKLVSWLDKKTDKI